MGRQSYALVVAYDGTHYAGWQLQAPPKPKSEGGGNGEEGGRGEEQQQPPQQPPKRKKKKGERPPPATVQEAVERALATCLRAPSRDWLGVVAAGRTDAGVHAAGQVVQFYWDDDDQGGGGGGGGSLVVSSSSANGAVAALDLSFSRGLPARLNGLLPPDVRVLSAHRTAPDFVATASATAKAYRYEVDLTPWPARDPLSAHARAPRGKRPLDVEAVRRAARLFLGEHDFSAFSNRDDRAAAGGGRGGGSGRDPVKTIEAFDVKVFAGGEGGAGGGGEWAGGGAMPSYLRMDVRGTGFLYKQVRHMAGALIAVGAGQMSEAEIRRRLELGAAWSPGGGGAGDEEGSGSESSESSSGSSGGEWRGYNVAPARGLCLMGVRYPSGAFDPSRLLYPSLKHDAWGRLAEAIPPQVVRAARREAAAASTRSGSSSGSSSGF